jgi:hypothetical protein
MPSQLLLRIRQTVSAVAAAFGRMPALWYVAYAAGALVLLLILDSAAETGIAARLFRSGVSSNGGPQPWVTPLDGCGPFGYTGGYGPADSYPARPAVGTGDSGDSTCHITYVPSPFEDKWRENVGEWRHRPCHVLSNEQGANFQKLVDAVEAQELLRCDALGNRTRSAYGSALRAASSSLLSRMEYRRGGPSGPVVGSVLLEPLAGVLRDPRPVCWPPYQESKYPYFTPHKDQGADPKAIMGKFHLLDPGLGAMAGMRPADDSGAAAGIGGGGGGVSTSPFRSPFPHPPTTCGASGRALLFDIGASTWVDRYGLAWALQSYMSVGISFEHVYAWEALAVTPSYFTGMPADVRMRVHLFNMPASSAEGSVENPFTVLKAKATPADYVVVKLDIDTPSVEMPLIHQLLTDPQLAALVDDFYFEHHVDIPEMRAYWGEGLPGNLKESLDLFRALREKGIRAHSWP